MLDRIVRGERDALAGRDPLPAQESRDAAHEPAQVAVAQGAAVVGGNDVGLVGMKLGRAVDPRPQQAGTRIGGVRRNTVQCNIAHVDSRRPDLIAASPRATSRGNPAAAGIGWRELSKRQQETVKP